MYSLILTVSLIVNGVVSSEPTKVFEIKSGFQANDICMGYLDSDEGAQFKKVVLPNIAVRMRGSPYVVGYSYISSESL